MSRVLRDDAIARRRRLGFENCYLVLLAVRVIPGRDKRRQVSLFYRFRQYSFRELAFAATLG